MDSNVFAILPLGWELVSNFLALGLFLVVAFLGFFGIVTVLDRH